PDVTKPRSATRAISASIAGFSSLSRLATSFVKLPAPPPAAHTSHVHLVADPPYQSSRGLPRLIPLTDFAFVREHVEVVLHCAGALVPVSEQTGERRLCDRFHGVHHQARRHDVAFVVRGRF